MPELDLGSSTTLEVLALSGSTVEDRGDHLVVRTPSNPTFHWGNCILVTDPAASDEADRWVRAFASTFPSATWVAISLPRMPADPPAWTAHRLGLEVDDVLVASTLPRQSTPPEGYTVHRLDGADWEQNLALEAAVEAADGNDWTTDSETGAYTPFALARNEAKRTICADGTAAYFGAFADGSLVAGLGIVRCGATARYQDVLTHPDHRRRGLASHLLGVAAGWAGSHGCDRWVIVTETTNPAGRIYRRAGLEPHSTKVSAYRPDAR